jgi:hypothetical protein
MVKKIFKDILTQNFWEILLKAHHKIFSVVTSPTPIK